MCPAKMGWASIIFYQSFERRLYLSEDRMSAHVDEAIVLEAIYRPMTEYISEHYVTNGSVENIHLDGEPFDVHERVGVNTASTKLINPALKPGEQITLKKTADYVGVFPDNIEWLSVLVSQPIGVIDYWAHFNAYDMPKKCGNIITMLQLAGTSMSSRLTSKTTWLTSAYIIQT